MRRIFTALLFILAVTICATVSFAQTESRNDDLNQIKAKSAELATLETRFLAPSDEDRAAYTEFLKQPDTGLIRLLPREVYDSTPTSQTLTIRGGGAYYSFARLTHAYGYGSDLELQHGELSVGFAGADYGMLARINDVFLEDLSADHPAVRSIASYAAKSELPEARNEYRRFQEGLVIDGLNYKSHLPVTVGATYILRSIDYSSSDVLVAFRVVRRDTDGSVIIAWKLLRKYAVPHLARN